ncbi:hypothetical protein PT2222_300047 [Paraburkholderia tropica]
MPLRSDRFPSVPPARWARPGWSPPSAEGYPYTEFAVNPYADIFFVTKPLVIVFVRLWNYLRVKLRAVSH